MFSILCCKTWVGEEFNGVDLSASDDVLSGSFRRVICSFALCRMNNAGVTWRCFKCFYDWVSILNKGLKVLMCFVTDILRTMGERKDTKAPVTSKEIPGTASPSGIVHVGPTNALGLGGLRINPSSDLNRCDKTIVAKFLHADFVLSFLQEAKLPGGGQTGWHSSRHQVPGPHDE